MQPQTLEPSSNRERLLEKLKKQIKSRKEDVNTTLDNIYRQEVSDFWDQQKRKRRRIKDQVLEEVEQLRSKLLVEASRKRAFFRPQAQQPILFARSPNAFYVYKQRTQFADLTATHQNSEETSRNEQLDKSPEAGTVPVHGLRQVIAPSIKAVPKASDTRVHPLHPPLPRLPRLKRSVAPGGPEPLVSIISPSKSFQEVAIDPRRKRRSVPRGSLKGNAAPERRVRSRARVAHRASRQDELVSRSLFLDDMIRRCAEMEDRAGKSLAETDKSLDVTNALADTYKEVSRKVDKLAYASPHMLEYLYYLDRVEDDSCRTDVGGLLTKFRSRSFERCYRSKLLQGKR